LKEKKNYHAEEILGLHHSRETAGKVAKEGLGKNPMSCGKLLSRTLLLKDAPQRDL